MWPSCAYLSRGERKYGLCYGGWNWANFVFGIKERCSSLANVSVKDSKSYL